MGLPQKWPLDLVLCSDCSLLQLRHNAPQDILYSRHYWYRSGTNATMYHALKNVVLSAIKRLEDPRGIWLDIGANDGTLLSHVPFNFHRIGCEPARNLTPYLRYHCNNVLDDFWSAKNYYDRFDCPADVITAIGMLYDLEDPNSFVADIHDVLAPDGLLVVQLMCLEQMIRNKDVGNICHEHLEYYSLDNLRRLFARHGLHVFGVEENKVNGGSYRLYVRHATDDDGATDPFGTTPVTRDDIYWFVRDIEENRDKCVQFVKDEVNSGKSVWVYGASTKGNVILQYYGLDDSVIDAAADRNPEKWGLVMAGSNIPILSEDAMRESQPDYLLCLPYAFFEEFYDREKEWWQQGGQWILPIPDFMVV